jgi:hypothetical protein
MRTMAENFLVLLLPLSVYLLVIPLTWGFIAWRLIEGAYQWCAQSITARRFMPVDWECVRFAPIFILGTLVTGLEIYQAVSGWFA